VIADEAQFRSNHHLAGIVRGEDLASFDAGEPLDPPRDGVVTDGIDLASASEPVAVGVPVAVEAAWR
jgi:hypothetical protein